MALTPTRSKRQLTGADLMPLAEYGKIRRDKRRDMSALKKLRRVEVGPVATFYFENYDTMWQQVQEMLYIEKGGEAQVEDELTAYNPLIPQGSELVATVMFEITDPDRRARMLMQLSHVEDHSFIEVGGSRIRGEADQTRENTSPEGKASSVQFIRFAFSAQQIADFRVPGARVIIGFDHPNYGHMAAIPEAVRQTLAGDFD